MITSDTEEPHQPIRLVHAGNARSFEAQGAADGRSILLTTTSDERGLVIAIDGPSPMELFWPSIEGDVIWVLLSSGSEQFYCTNSGRLLTVHEVAEMKQHFYD